MYERSGIVRNGIANAAARCNRSKNVRSETDATAQLYGSRSYRCLRAMGVVRRVEVGEKQGQALRAQPEGGAVGVAVVALREAE